MAVPRPLIAVALALAASGCFGGAKDLPGPTDGAPPASRPEPPTLDLLERDALTFLVDGAVLYRVHSESPFLLTTWQSPADGAKKAVLFYAKGTYDKMEAGCGPVPNEVRSLLDVPGAANNLANVSEMPAGEYDVLLASDRRTSISLSFGEGFEKARRVDAAGLRRNATFVEFTAWTGSDRPFQRAVAGNVSVERPAVLLTAFHVAPLAALGRDESSALRLAGQLQPCQERASSDPAFVRAGPVSLHDPGVGLRVAAGTPATYAFSALFESAAGAEGQRHAAAVVLEPN